MTNRELATKIFEELVKKGASIGNASVLIIENVLDRYVVDGAASGLSAASQSTLGKKQMDDYEFNLKRHWKDEEDSRDDDVAAIKHFQD